MRALRFFREGIEIFFRGGMKRKLLGSRRFLIVTEFFYLILQYLMDYKIFDHIVGIFFFFFFFERPIIKMASI